MNKVAIFVEGQGELILTRNIIRNILNLQYVGCECRALYREQVKKVPFDFSASEEKIHFKIINVGNDEKVISAIQERAPRLEQDGYSSIIGLRDLYSRSYRQLSNGRIDSTVTKKFIDGHENELKKTKFKGNINFIFSIMEMESWMLAAYEIFEKHDKKLTLKNINNKLGYDISKVDPQIKFYHPTRIVEQIFSISNKEYKKKSNQSESLSSYFTQEVIENVINRGICDSFKRYYQLIQTYNIINKN